MVKEPNAVWHNSGRKDCLVFIGYQYKVNSVPEKVDLTAAARCGCVFYLDSDNNYLTNAVKRKRDGCISSNCRSCFFSITRSDSHLTLRLAPLACISRERSSDRSADFCAGFNGGIKGCLPTGVFGASLIEPAVLVQPAPRAKAPRNQNGGPP